MKEFQSIGLVETVGLIPAVEAADAMAKAARVTVVSVANADAGLISVICTGDLAACNAAVDAGKAAASRVGECVNSTLIPRPDADMHKLLLEKVGSVFASAKKKEETKPAGKQSAGKSKK